MPLGIPGIEFLKEENIAKKAKIFHKTAKYFGSSV
jgi:hypothetical protein